jgi:ABC-type enterochelin transport system permease subunit
MGMGTKLRVFYFGRNRNLFMRRHAPFIGKIIYFLIFMHVFSGYYFMAALKNRRIDIAFSYLKGVIYGCFCPIEIRSKIDVKDLIIDEYIRTE